MAELDISKIAGTMRVARLRVPGGFVIAALVLWLARPSWTSLAVGAAVAALGATLRIWAAGHLEKATEVTSSGPYRLMRHPLYVGSAIVALGIIIAAADGWVMVLVACYLGITLTAAVRLEDAWLRARFGARYENYAAGRGAPSRRRFSAARAWANGEHLAILGLLAGLAIFALKAWLGI